MSKVDLRLERLVEHISEEVPVTGVVERISRKKGRRRKVRRGGVGLLAVSTLAVATGLLYGLLGAFGRPPSIDRNAGVQPTNGLIAFAFLQLLPNREDLPISFDIFVVNEDGTGLMKLTTVGPHDSAPAWSPDGRRIAFVRQLHPGETYDEAVYVMNADGTDLTKLHETSLPKPPLPTITQVRWSPDGSQIGFIRIEYPAGAPSQGHSSGDERRVLIVMNSDGTGVVPVNEESHQVMSFSWSPNGERIALTRRLVFGEGEERTFLFDVHVMGTDGTGETQLTTNGRSWSPVWSPDGTKIVFTSAEEGAEPEQKDVYVMDTDGAGRVRLTDDGRSDSSPEWSPDGTRIVFSRYLGMNLDREGSLLGWCDLVSLDPARMTEDIVVSGRDLDGCAGGPSWQPVFPEQ